MSSTSCPFVLLWDHWCFGKFDGKLFCTGTPHSNWFLFLFVKLLSQIYLRALYKCSRVRSLANLINLESLGKFGKLTISILYEYISIS